MIFVTLGIIHAWYIITSKSAEKMRIRDNIARMSGVTAYDETKRPVVVQTVSTQYD